MAISLIFMEVSGQVCSAQNAVLDNCFSLLQVRSSPHYPNWYNTIARMGSWRRRMARPLSWSSRLFALSPPQKGKWQCTLLFAHSPRQMLLTVAPTAVLTALLTGVLTAVAVIVFSPVLCCCCHCAADAATDVAMLSIIHIRIHIRTHTHTHARIHIRNTHTFMFVYLHLCVCVACISMLSGSPFLDPIPHTLVMQGSSATLWSTTDYHLCSY